MKSKLYECQPKGTQSIPRTDLPPKEYTITRDGQVIRPNGKPLSLYDRGGGYLCVDVKGKRYVVHRIVALKYIPNPENKPEIDHIDGNIKNNCVDNLRWVTRQENEMNPITRKRISESLTGRILTEEWKARVSKGLTGKKQSEERKRKLSEKLKGKHKSYRVPVIRIDRLTGETIRFCTISEAAKETGISTTTISDNLKGYYNSPKYIWKKETEQT